jgi:hypothetical protein
VKYHVVIWCCKNFILPVLFLRCDDLLQLQKNCQSEANSRSDKFGMGHCLLMHAKKFVHTSNVSIKSSVKLRVPLLIFHHYCMRLHAPFHSETATTPKCYKSIITNQH